MIVLDTHVWVWWLSQSGAIPVQVRKAIKEAQTIQAIYVSTISTWEVAQLTDRGRLRLTMDVTAWLAQAESLPFLNFVPIDNHIALKSVQLPGPLHQDPADRIIIATALTLGATLLTKDRKILAYSHVKTMW